MLSCVRVGPSARTSKWTSHALVQMFPQTPQYHKGCMPKHNGCHRGRPNDVRDVQMNSEKSPQTLLTRQATSYFGGSTSDFPAATSDSTGTTSSSTSRSPRMPCGTACEITVDVATTWHPHGTADVTKKERQNRMSPSNIIDVKMRFF